MKSKQYSWDFQPHADDKKITLFLGCSWRRRTDGDLPKLARRSRERSTAPDITCNNFMAAVELHCGTVQYNYSAV